MAVILVAEDDADIAAALEINLNLEGYKVHVCHDGDAVVGSALEVHPDLVLLDLVLPGTDGLAIARTLRSDPRTADVPILLVTARTSSVDRLNGFDAGADDYIVKPFDMAELLARVRATLRRTSEMREISPLTGLPGNFRIGEELDRRAAEPTADYAVVYLDLNSFKSFNDHYGFLRGDGVIKLTADVLVSCLQTLDPDGFVGHIGGDDFVVVCAAEVAEQLCECVIDRFDREILTLYDESDVARGWIETIDRLGATCRYPPVSVALGVATTLVRPLGSRWEASEVASEMKQHAKRPGRSAFEIDRRGSVP